MPYETIERRSHLTPEEIIGNLTEFLRFYALPDAPLCKGRLLQLKGDLGGQQGATGLYQSARPSYHELGYLSKLPSGKELDKMQQELLKMKEDLAKVNRDPTADVSPFLQNRREEVDEQMANLDLAKMVKSLEEEYTDVIMKTIHFNSEEEKKAAETAFKQEALRLMLVNIVQGKQDATYWMGLIAYERGNYNSAADYLWNALGNVYPRTMEQRGQV